MYAGATALISHAADLITQLVSNMSEHSTDVRLLERIRRGAASGGADKLSLY